MFICPCMAYHAVTVRVNYNPAISFYKMHLQDTLGNWLSGMSFSSSVSGMSFSSSVSGTMPERSLVTRWVTFILEIISTLYSLALLHITLRVLAFFPERRKHFIASKHKSSCPGYLSAEQWGAGLLFWPVLRQRWSKSLRRAATTRILGMKEKVPSFEVHHVTKLGTITECDFLDFAKPGRHLVVNFGSCSWPPFIKAFDDFCSLSRKYSSDVDFVVVYTMEAHPTDGWHYPAGRFHIKQSRCLEERIAAAKNLLEMGLSCPLLVDSMDNEVTRAFDAFPERLYAILDGRVAFVGGPGPYFYDVKELDKWLAKRL